MPNKLNAALCGLLLLLGGVARGAVIPKTHNGLTGHWVLIQTNTATNGTLAFVPERIHTCRKTKRLDAAIYFHGFFDNPNDYGKYGLPESVLDSEFCGVLFVPIGKWDKKTPEGKKEKPGSDWGLLSRDNGLTRFFADVLPKLSGMTTPEGESLIPNAPLGRVALIAHSAGANAVAVEITSGGIPVERVILLDAYYLGEHRFATWAKADPSRRFLGAYTPGYYTRLFNDLFHRLPQGQEGFHVAGTRNHNELVKKELPGLLRKLQQHWDTATNHPSLALN